MTGRPARPRAELAQVFHHQTVTAARLGASVVDIGSWHDPMICQPAVVASVINLAGRPGEVNS